MGRMHANEALIDDELVLRLVAGQFPRWSGLAVAEIPSSGTVNAMYRLGDSLTVRLPRIAGGVPDIEKEFEWLPRLAPLLPVRIPTPVALGEPADGYPWPWLVQEWIPGSIAVAGEVREPVGLAEDLAGFVRAMRSIDAPARAGGEGTAGPSRASAAGTDVPDGLGGEGIEAPAAYRGGPLSSQDEETRKALVQLEGWIDTGTALAAWESALAAPASSPCWVHADLMPSNLLVTDGGRLAAVIDFATAGVGDPACDLIPAWNLLPAAGREVYREALGVDADAWVRGRGRALSMALIQLPYYRDTNPGIAANAQHVINEVLADFTAR
ncbi:aminoglycoside phosphotransferase family protein [Kribbella ginsengisoli]|uniref:Aminoglycoside phosphotransferase family protein n=1 Tax=Kribbella ginsengisoli TaxID=363865 RepID=A0ABP6WG05_9ACTN